MKNFLLISMIFCVLDGITQVPKISVRPPEPPAFKSDFSLIDAKTRKPWTNQLEETLRNGDSVMLKKMISKEIFDSNFQMFLDTIFSPTLKNGWKMHCHYNSSFGNDNKATYNFSIAKPKSHYKNTIQFKQIKKLYPAYLTIDYTFVFLDSNVLITNLYARVAYNGYIDEYSFPEYFREFSSITNRLFQWPNLRLRETYDGAIDRLRRHEKQIDTSMILLNDYAQYDFYCNFVDNISHCMATEYGRCSWYALCLNQPLDAKEFAEKGLENDPEEIWIITNLALANVMLGDLDSAKKIYREYSDKLYMNRLFREVFITDIATLQNDGIKSDYFEQALEYLKR